MNSIDVVILCGGQGSRLTPLISDRPKPMADINGKPFLDLVIGHYKSFGIRRFILCTGHMSGFIENYYLATEQAEAKIAISKENSPLGTAGALKGAAKHIKSDTFFVVNGDSFCNIDPSDFYAFHRRKAASVSMVVTEPGAEAQSCGSVITERSQRITWFMEKTTISETPLINAGIYLFNKNVLSLIPPQTKYSLEYDLFPKLAGSEFYAYITNEPLFDIGTPERYERAVRELGIY